MHQPLFGACTTLLVALVIYAIRRGHASFGMLIITPLAMLFGAVWAVVPDLPRLVGAHALYSRLSRAPWTDIFLWHHTIDRIETNTLDRMTPLFNTLFTLLVLLLLAAAWRELRRAETNGTPPRTP